jgi:hypothetical protein
MQNRDVNNMQNNIADIFQAKTETLQELMSENVGYYIPAYQRNYSWDKGTAQTLLDDIREGLVRLAKEPSGDACTFIGSVILVWDREFITISPQVQPELPAKVYNVIDGQQRLTTLTATCAALHYWLTENSNKPSMQKSLSADSALSTFLKQQIAGVLKDLEKIYTFQPNPVYEKSYPRIVTCFKDTWGSTPVTARYTSPIANLIDCYNNHTASDSTPKSKFEWEPILIDVPNANELANRFREILAFVNKIAKSSKSELSIFEGEISLLSNLEAQRNLTTHPWPLEITEAIEKEANSQIIELMRVLFYSIYTIKRVPLTVVRTQTEFYAFEIFQALNTTGTPLTALETFRPELIRSEGLANWEASLSKPAFEDRVMRELNITKVKDRAKLSKDLLTTFAQTATGEKLGSHVAHQRAYLDRIFDFYKGSPESRHDFVQHLGDVPDFVSLIWNKASTGEATFSGFDHQSNEEISYCLASLHKLNHEIAAAPIIRYINFETSTGKIGQIENIRCAVKAIHAFSILRRAFTGSTKQIDDVYRKLMSGDLAGFSKISSSGLGWHIAANPPTYAELKMLLVDELCSTILGTGTPPFDVESKSDVSNLKSAWITKTSRNNLYEYKQIARALLLAAHKGSVTDKRGLLVPATDDEPRTLKFADFAGAETHWLEHIAPQTRGLDNEWDAEIYEESPNVIHEIGNLMLLPDVVNISAGNKSWNEKSTLYRALSQGNPDEAREIIRSSGIEFPDNTIEIFAKGYFSTEAIPLAKLGEIGDPFNRSTITSRSENLLDRAWENLFGDLTPSP